MKYIKSTEKKENTLEGKQKQNRPEFKEEIYPRDNNDIESIKYQQKKNLRTYLNIFHSPSFRNLSRNIQSNYDVNAPFVSEQEAKEAEIKYDYPVNIFKQFLFTWTRKVLLAANSKPNLDMSDLGRFHPDLYPDKLLADIKPVLDKVSKRAKSNPLIKALILQNIWILILMFVENIFVIGSETLNVLL